LNLKNNFKKSAHPPLASRPHRQTKCYFT